MPILNRSSALVCAVFAMISVLPNASTGGTLFGPSVPESAVPPTPESLARMYAGKTENWGGGAAAYWAANGTFRAVNPTEQSIGIGKWYVTTASRMCYEGRWYWRQDFGVEDSTFRTCTRFLIDEDGQMWTTTKARSGPWFPFDLSKLQRGNQVSERFETLQDLLGVDAQDQ
ncbi:DUF995 domain-containing protein [Sediminimonas qiaohouensis]|uniref:DUF995 domain-containing protein n=1 Tax=Sediminimonas qiaohouensis TaxID=552061 RepID=UPI0004114F1C|nr:DUF995 domain-containing protein [Sediminimonas qiaohouensis]